MKLKFALAAVFAATFSAGAVAAEGDVEAGMKVYKKCKACHVVEEEKNRVGPHLVKIIDRAVGSVDGYKYSKAMAAKGEEGLVWTVENLDAYLTKPKDFIPKTKMAFPGLKKPEDRVNLIAYLKSLSE